MIGQHIKSLSTLDFLVNLMFGTGFDGDAAIAVDTVLARPMFYRNLHISAGVVRVHNTYPMLYVQDTLTIDAGAELRDFFSLPGGNGTNATSSAHGIGGVGGGNGGGNGGNGGPVGNRGTTSPDNYMAWPTEQFLVDGHPLGGYGGSGGSEINAGGVGVVSKIVGYIGTVRHPFFSFQPWYFDQTGKGYGFLQLLGCGGGGGGGGVTAGGSHSGGGGAGGDPAGPLWVFARHIILNGKLFADGGNGGNGGNGNGANSDGGGGGGGGSGGYICVVCQTITNPALVTANGGLGGAFGIGTLNNGETGFNGEAGIVDLYD